MRGFPVKKGKTRNQERFKGCHPQSHKTQFQRQEQGEEEASEKEYGPALNLIRILR